MSDSELPGKSVSQIDQLGEMLKAMAQQVGAYYVSLALVMPADVAHNLTIDMARMWWATMIDSGDAGECEEDY